MKEIKEFIQELCDCAKPSANGRWDGIVHNPDCKCNKKIKSTTQY